VQNTALAYFVAKWVMVGVSVKRGSRKADIEAVLNRFHVLHGEGMARASFEIIAGLLALKKIDASTVINYSPVVVDEAHHLRRDVAIEKIEKLTVGSSGGAKKPFVPRLLLSDVPQSSSTSTHGTNLFNGLFRYDRGHAKEVTPSQVVRDSRKIVAGAWAFQMDAGGEPTECLRTAYGPPLKAVLLANWLAPETRIMEYATEIMEARIFVTST
jgi:hypothetical protein